MRMWTIAIAAGLASVMFAASAFAQATTGGPAAGTETKSESPKGTEAKTDRAQSPDAVKSGAMQRSRKSAMATGDERVKAAQQALKDKGHDPGTVDGKLGPKTQGALRDFQKAQGIEATGGLDTTTMQALGVEMGRTSSADAPATIGSASPATSDTSSSASPATGGTPKSDDAKTTGEKK
jgi:peptidoglycan hydrolase-like protein with peptidoglycan-binding domain